MYLKIKPFELEYDGDGHTEMTILEIAWGDHIGSLFFLRVCPDCDNCIELLFSNFPIYF